MRLDKIYLIKLDIEGSEINAIIGGVKTIAKYRPKMAICVYHKLYDLYEISIFID